MTIAKVEEGLKGGSLPKKKLDLPMTLDKDTLCTNIPSNITAKLERVWRKVLYQKKLYLPMTIYMECSCLFTKGYSKMFCMWKKGERNKSL